MQPLSELLATKQKKAKPPPHEHAASVNAIMDFMLRYPKERQMKRGYWDARVKGVRDGDVMAILKDAASLPHKYGKGGFITNRLKALSTGVDKPKH